MATDVAMNDMDIDFDMDAEVDPEIARLQAEADAINARAEAAETEEAMNGVEEAEEGEVDASAPAPNKVHVRGLDNLSQNDIMQWAEEHAAMELFKKVQWIDDTSANLMYDTEAAAADALNAFSAEEVVDPLQLRQAKGLSTQPQVELQVRQAIVADVKAPGAKDRSKFYLFNPDWDPDNPGNIRRDSRKRGWNEDNGRDRKYRRRDWGNDRYRGREPRSKAAFHEDMYGDDPQTGDNSRRNSHSSFSDTGRRQVKYDDDVDLIASKDRGRLRDRSASPIRDGDGRYGFDDDQPRRPTARARSRSPPGIRAGRDNKSRRDEIRKELFPDKRSNSAFADDAMDVSRDARTNRSHSSSIRPELFPERSGSIHRRQSAKHISANEVADAIGRRPENDDRTRDRGRENGGGRDLFARIAGGPKAESSYGRLNDRSALEDTGFSIKGAGENGFSILGASRERTQNPLVKELFPRKAANNEDGKDLFDGRIKGRGAPRKRAEEYF